MFRSADLDEVQEIVSSPQAKAYDGVEHSVAQKVTELRGEAHRRSKTRYGSMVEQLHLEQCVQVQVLLSTKSKSLLLSQLKSALMAGRKEPAHGKLARGLVFM